LGELAGQEATGLTLAEKQQLPQLQQATRLLTILSFGSESMAEKHQTVITLENIPYLLPQIFYDLLSALLGAHSSELGLQEPLLERQIQRGVGGAGGQGVASGPNAAGAECSPEHLADTAVEVQLASLSREGVEGFLEDHASTLRDLKKAAGDGVQDVVATLLFIEQYVFQIVCDNGHQQLADHNQWSLAGEEPHAALGLAALCHLYDDLSVIADQLLVAAGVDISAAAKGQQLEPPPRDDDDDDDDDDVDEDDTNSQPPGWLVHLMAYFEVELQGAPAFNRFGGAGAVYTSFFKELQGIQYEGAANLADVLQQAARTLVADSGFTLYTKSAMAEAAQVS
jgi:hypothetical protein